MESKRKGNGLEITIRSKKPRDNQRSRKIIAPMIIVEDEMTGVLMTGDDETIETEAVQG